jgi:hypothetical protein
MTLLSAGNSFHDAASFRSRRSGTGPEYHRIIHASALQLAGARLCIGSPVCKGAHGGNWGR